MYKCTMYMLSWGSVYFYMAVVVQFNVRPFYGDIYLCVWIGSSVSAFFFKQFNAH